ncbi:MAG: EF2563 family selenium-dependent molybdenum hydroxylase system protein [Chloroflexi bacterium]|nr:EF2563 family selenium-dependent molybdenum hydroxylase system protein [Chloroflexota bacterium]
MNKYLTVVRGGGDLATGVVYRLVRAGFPVVVTEAAEPTVVRRTVALAEAVYQEEVVVEGLRGRRVNHPDAALAVLKEGMVPVLVDPQALSVAHLRPWVVVDAIMAKRNLGTRISDAPVVVALGPGFQAGVDAHAVIETNRGHYLGRVILQGSAEPNTGVPGPVGGYSVERVLRAPGPGVVRAAKQIGAEVKVGEVVAWVGEQAVEAPIQGILRGLIREGIAVRAGTKMGDIDPRAAREHCFTISDKALAVGGGALEAVLYLLQRRIAEMGEDPSTV